MTVHASGPPDAPCVVLVHGLTDAGTTWPDAVERWHERWRLLAVDLRGHGSSPRFGPRAPRVTDVWLGDLLDLLRSLPSRPVLVGHSLGAHLALRAVLDTPGLVRAAVLEDPPLPQVDENDTLPEFRAEQHRLLDAFTDGIDAEVARMRAETPWSQREVVAWAACKPLVERAMIDRLELPERDWPALLEQVAVPTLCVAPTHGALSPFVAHARNPLITTAFVDGAGHCVRRDAPDAYHAVVDPFVAGHLTAEAGSPTR
ncbi:alpha/beta fold hydrolase [Xylanimonas ulmi]|nr:alpha/beta hydrolase [Xylanibacterium ulmi]